MDVGLSLRVVAGVVRRLDQILITQRLADDSWGNYWEFPGGKVEAGESDSMALQRELLEELEITVTPGQFLWEHVEDSGAARLVVRFFYCSLVSGNPACREVQALKWVSRPEFGNYRFLPSNDVLLRKLIDEEI